jgi:hypothetical protein
MELSIRCNKYQCICGRINAATSLNAKELALSSSPVQFTLLFTLKKVIVLLFRAIVIATNTENRKKLKFRPSFDFCFAFSCTVPRQSDAFM